MLVATMRGRVVRSSHVGTVTLLCCVLALALGGAGAALGGGRCKLKRHTHKAMQTDLNGRRCWDDVKIYGCGGYCMSYEISDWQFPYKQSHHPVCVHGQRRHASATLRHCDRGAQPGTDVFHYVEATSCKCQACSSEDTSCEWLPPDSSLLGGLVLREEIEEEEDLDQNTL